VRHGAAAEAMWPQDSVYLGLFWLGERGAGRERCGSDLGKERVNAVSPLAEPGDNSWQMTAATLVGLMSVPGLVVLYGGVMQKRWSVNSMMLAFVAFALVLVMWVLYGFKMGFGHPMHISGRRGIAPRQLPREAGPGVEPPGGQGQGKIRTSARRVCSTFRVVACLFPVRLRGDHADLDAGLGARRVNFKAWIPSSCSGRPVSTRSTPS